MCALANSQGISLSSRPRERFSCSSVRYMRHHRRQRHCRKVTLLSRRVSATEEDEESGLARDHRARYLLTATTLPVTRDYSHFIADLTSSARLGVSLPSLGSTVGQNCPSRFIPLYTLFDLLFYPSVNKEYIQANERSSLLRWLSLLYEPVRCFQKSYPLLHGFSSLL